MSKRESERARERPESARERARESEREGERPARPIGVTGNPAQLLRCQYLYFCTSIAGKLGTCL
jgi:hypothetical protein